MANVNDMKKFIKAKELKPTDTLTFLNAGQINKDVEFKQLDGTIKKQDVFQIKVRLNDDELEKTINLNITSLNSLAEVYGEDTEQWIGKKGKAFKVGQNTHIIPKE